MVVRRLGGVAFPPSRTLVLVFDESGLRGSSACKCRIALAKASGGTPPNAVWLACAPAAVTTIVWTETYGVYAAAIPERSGARIHVAAAVYPAAERAVYAFLGSGFAPPAAAADLPRRHYEIRNASLLPAAFGLLQTAAVNEVAITAPLNAVVLPSGVGAEFTQFDTLYVWLQTDVSGATAAAHVPPAAMPVVYARGERIKRYRYDVPTSLFVPLPPRPEDNT